MWSFGGGVEPGCASADAGRRWHMRRATPPKPIYPKCPLRKSVQTCSRSHEGATAWFVQAPPGNTVFEIVAESETQFFWTDREYYLTFERNPTGEVTGVAIRNEGEVARWTRAKR